MPLCFECVCKNLYKSKENVKKNSQWSSDSNCDYCGKLLLGNHEMVGGFLVRRK